MFSASHSNYEVKHEVEVDNIAVLKKLRSFFMRNEYQGSESPDCELYNRVLAAYEAETVELVYDVAEKVYKLWVNDEPLELRNAIKTLAQIIRSLELSNTQSSAGTPDVSNSIGSRDADKMASRDIITTGHVTGDSVQIACGDTIINNHTYVNSKPIFLDRAALDAKEAQAVTQLKADYLAPEYATIKGIFGTPLQLDGQYINLQMLCVDLKNKKKELDKELKVTEEEKESKDAEELKDLRETKSDEKYKDARMASIEDLFGDKRTIKTEDLFKPAQELFNEKEVQVTEQADKVPRLLLIQGRAGIGKTTFVHYLTHQWSKGQLYANYTWVFTLTLRKLRLLPNTEELSLLEWIRLSQFSDWPQQEFDVLWQQRIEPAIGENKVLLILDGYDEIPENHPCQSVLKDLLTLGRRYPSLSLLVTTRLCSTREITEKRRNLEIVGFTDENIDQYIQTYFLKTSNKRLVYAVTEKLRKQPIIWANAHIPLNLNLLCGIMENAIKEADIEGLAREFTKLCSMTSMYEVMEKKLYAWAYSRCDTELLKTGGQLVRARTDFTKIYQNERLFLAKLAFQSFEAERIIISIGDIGDALKIYVDKQITEGSPKNIQQEKEKLGGVFFEDVCGLGLMKPVLDASGLSQVEQNYEFLHLTFQEYYTAIYLADELSSEEPTSKNFAEAVVLKEKYNPRWQIVWWFVAGLLREKVPVYKSYLQQLQGQSKNQTLTQDILQHYQLGLLTRCIDEGLQPNNQQMLEPFIKELQLSFLRLYQIANNIKNNDWNALKELAFINSPFFSACWISPNLCMSERQDLYALIEEAEYFLLTWIGTIGIVTPKALDVLLKKLLQNRNNHVRCSAAEVVGRLGGTAATPEILNALSGLLGDTNSDVRRSAVEAVRRLGPAAATPQFLDSLTGLLRDRGNTDSGSAGEVVGGLSDDAMPAILMGDTDNDVRRSVRRSVIEAVGGLGAAAATPEIIDAFAKLLGDTDSDVRRSVIEAVGKLGATTTHVLARLLEDTDNSVRRSAAEAVRRLGPAAATPQFLDALARLLGDMDRDVRCSAAEAVGRLGAAAVTSQIRDVLAKLLEDTDRDVRCSAVEAVGRLGTAAVTSQIRDALAKLLGDTDRDVRCSAAEAVGRLGAVAVTSPILNALARLLGDVDSNVRCSAVEAVGKLGAASATEQFLGALARLLENTNNSVRCSAVEAVGKLGAAAATSQVLFGQLATLLENTNRNVRCSAAWAVGGLGTAAATQQVLGLLGRLLGDTDRDVRHSAVEAVRKLGAAAATSEIGDALVRLLRDTDRDVRCSAVEAMGKLGAAAATSQVLSTLAKLLENKSSDVRCSAAAVVCRLGASAATSQMLGTLAKLLENKSSDVRCSAAAVVRKLGASAATSQMLGTLAKLLENKSKDVRFSAEWAVGGLGAAAATQQFLDSLARLLGHVDSGVRSSATGVVCKFGPAAAKPQIFDALTKLLADTDKGVCCSAANVVGELGIATEQMLEALIKLLVDTDRDVRRSAAGAVSRLDAVASPKLLDVLADLLVDEDKEVRCSAVKAVGKVAATPKILKPLAKLLVDMNEDVRYSATSALEKLNVVDTPEFLHVLLGILSVERQDNVMFFFKTYIRSTFTLISSFWLENAIHPNMFAFLAHSFAGAYLNAQISCQIDPDTNTQMNNYHYMRCFVGKTSYSFLLTSSQADCLHRLSALIIEQLSKTGVLNITELKASLQGWDAICQAPKNPPLLTQYRQVASGQSNQPLNTHEQDKTNRNHRGVSNVCRIS